MSDPVSQSKANRTPLLDSPTSRLSSTESITPSLFLSLSSLAGRTQISYGTHLESPIEVAAAEPIPSEFPRRAPNDQIAHEMQSFRIVIHLVDDLGIKHAIGHDCGFAKLVDARTQVAHRHGDTPPVDFIAGTIVEPPPLAGPGDEGVSANVQEHLGHDPAAIVLTPPAAYAFADDSVANSRQERGRDVVVRATVVVLRDTVVEERRYALLLPPPAPYFSSIAS